LDGYQLDSGGDAVERRSIYVLLGGLKPTESRSDSTRRYAAVE
jgi:hypothetical protein